MKRIHCIRSEYTMSICTVDCTKSAKLEKLISADLSKS